MVPGMTEREQNAAKARLQELLTGVARERAISQPRLAPLPERRAPLPLGVWTGVTMAVEILGGRSRAGWERVTSLVPGTSPTPTRHDDERDRDRAAGRFEFGRYQ